MTNKTIYGRLRFLAGAVGTKDIVSRVAGIAAGETGLFRVRSNRGLFEPVDDVVSVAEGINAVVHAVFLRGIDPLYRVGFGAVFPMNGFQELRGFAGMAILAGLRSFVAVLLDKRFTGMFVGNRGRCGGRSSRSGGSRWSCPRRSHTRDNESGRERSKKNLSKH